VVVTTMTDSLASIRADGARMALAVVGVLAVVVVGFGVVVGSIRLLLPVVYPLVPSADPTVVAAAVGFTPAAVYGVAVAAVLRRWLVTEE
jgi:hypothetical protein